MNNWKSVERRRNLTPEKNRWGFMMIKVSCFWLMTQFFLLSLHFSTRRTDWMVFGQGTQLGSIVLAPGFIKSEIPLWSGSSRVCEGSRRRTFYIKARLRSFIHGWVSFTPNRGNFHVHLCHSSYCSFALADDRVERANRIRLNGVEDRNKFN